MKAFGEDDGSIRRGKRVPEGDVNLAYVKAPELSPKENVVIVDTSQIIEENNSSVGKTCDLYYANSMGILTDKDGNIVISDEFPAVTDEFSVEEDYSKVPGSEYTAEDILPFEHVSRFFHLDSAGLTLGGEIAEYKTDKIKVVDNRGVEYPKYKIKISPAYLESYDLNGEEDVWAYRVFVYIDTDEDNNLFLRYNKIEIDVDGRFVNKKMEHQEILNVKPFFEYVPEESDVVDPSNRNKKIYSTKPVAYKNRVVGKKDSNADGYKVYVPRKAIGDPRIYQLFRWRVNCTFKETAVVDPTNNDVGSIKCGVLVTNQDLSRSTPTHSAFAFFNLARSRFNVSGAKFINPAKSSHSDSSQKDREYWLVNLDTDELDDYDILIFAPTVLEMDLSPYSPKLGDFITKGGIVFVDSCNYTDFGTTAGKSMTDPVWPKTRRRYTDNTLNSGVVATKPITRVDDYFTRGGSFGGWEITDTTIDFPSNSYLQHEDGLYSAHFGASTSWTHIYDGLRYSDNEARPVTLYKKFGKGYKILSTFGQTMTCSARFRYQDNELVSRNMGPTISTRGNYTEDINGAGVEEAMKFLYNVCLRAVQNKILDSRDEAAFSTTWQHSTEWKSSWVIKAGDGVLSEQERSDHNFLIDARDVYAGETDPVWKRRLSNKTVKSLIDQSLRPLLKDPKTRARIENAEERTYTIEVTNQNVDIASRIEPNDYPQAWTEAYTPKFIVPVELGPHIIKDEVTEDGRKGRKPQYESEVYTKYSYPDQPYAGQVITTFAASEEYSTSESATWTALGSGRGTIEITTWTPAKVIEHTETTDLEISWYDAHAQHTDNPGAYDNPNGDLFYTNTTFPYFGMPRTVGLQSWQDSNYYTSAWGPGKLAWQHYGITRRLVVGSTGDEVKFVQDAMNRFLSAGYFSTSAGNLAIDGQYGSLTSRAVRDFQTTFQARYIDGVVDAETWSLIGAQVLRLRSTGLLPSSSLNIHDYRVWFTLARQRMGPHQLSDGVNQTAGWSKRSWISGGPSVIWDLIAIKYDQEYDWNGITVVPYVEGAADTIMVRSIHVLNHNGDLTNYNSTSGQMTNLPFRPSNGQELFIPFGPYRGDTIIVGIGQDQSSGWGSSRMLGIKDIRGHTRISSTETELIPSELNITYQTENFSFSKTGSIKIDAFAPKSITIQPPAFPEYHSVSNVQWDSISVDNPEVNVTLSGNRATFESQVVVADVAENQTTKGSKFPNFTYYSMDENRRISKHRETGWVSKSEGIKLLCNEQGRPVGFPPMPTGVGSNEYQQHYTKIALSTQGTASSVRMGFYDIERQEFVVSPDGKPRMSYLEYIQRGPQNIYVAVMVKEGDDVGVRTTHEPFPEDDDAPMLPYKWAMPVYGVCSRSGSKISLQPLPDKLGVSELWPVAVRDGKFSRKQRIRSKKEGHLTGLMSSYQGTVVEAFYSIPEAQVAGWSTEHGAPNMDVVGEEPIILDDDVIQVRQAPILITRYLTSARSNADPHRAAIKLYKRDSITDPWVEQPWSEIRDYNSSTGEIFLKTKLTSDDASLLRVDYTTTRRSYYFKKHQERLLNLNAYSGHMKDLIGEPIYIYIVPHYIKDSEGTIIPGSYNSTTLRMTTNPAVFDPVRAEYDPLAIQLGTIYMSTALDINDVAIIDTRRRGGGLKDNANAQEVARLVSDASTYWDIEPHAGVSYQKSGYVIIRLPEELKSEFSESEIREIIERNITAGVAFKVEDLNGADWSSS